MFIIPRGLFMARCNRLRRSRLKANVARGEEETTTYLLMGDDEHLYSHHLDPGVLPGHVVLRFCDTFFPSFVHLDNRYAKKRSGTNNQTRSRGDAMAKRTE